MFAKAKYINTLRNRAVHEERTIRPADAAGAVKELFHVCFWLARTYARKAKPADGLAFDASRAVAPRRDAEEGLRASEGAAGRARRQERRADEAARRQAEPRRRAEAAARRGRRRAEAASEAAPDRHDYNEAETRDRYIDLLLREAGWALDRPEDLEFRVEGMPNNEGVGFVDYVLWGADGKPLGLVEAKRTRKDARQGQQQAKLYADRLEARLRPAAGDLLLERLRALDLGRQRYPPRQIGGFYKRDELELLIQRRTSRKKLVGDAAQHARSPASGPTSSAPSARSPRASRRTASARRCWSWRPAPARRAR